MTSPAGGQIPDKVFTRRLLQVAGLVLFAIVAWQLAHVILLLFGAAVLAVLFHSLAGPLSRWTSLRPGLALLIVVLSLAALLGAAGWLFGRELQNQISEFSGRLPGAIQEVERRLNGSPLGVRAVDALEGFSPTGISVVSRVGSALSTTAGAVLSVILVLVGSFYLAAQPELYRKGMLRLIPAKRREMAEQLIDRCVANLKRWLLAQLISMTVVAVLVGGGLYLIGVPAPLALGLLAGLLEFVPLAGPILTSVPVLLMAMTVGPSAMFWTVLLLIGVQQLESNIITPLVHRQVVSIPPLATLFAVVAFGVLFGVGGVILAAPMTVVAFVAIKVLYLRETPDSEGEASGGA